MSSKGKGFDNFHIVASHQPHFNPYLGYFAKMHLADTFIVSDDVQFVKNGFIHRNRIRSWQNKDGDRWRWLTIPVHYASCDRINQVRIGADPKWITRLRNVVAYEYRHAPHYASTFSLLEAMTASSPAMLTGLLYPSLAVFGYAMGIIPNVRFASSLPYTASPGDKNGRLIAMTKAVGGDAYLAGAEAVRTYIDPQRFSDANIKLLALHYHQPEYKQVHGEFLSKMSVLDCLMNIGFKAQHLIGREHCTITALN